MKYRGKRWNNMLILAVIVFIAVLNLPTLIKTYLIHEDTPASAGVTLLNPHKSLQAIYTSDWSLEESQSQWQLTPPSSISAKAFAERWQDLEGTLVDDETFKQLESKRSLPQSVEVWYDGVEEPQRITAYYLKTFWLFKNWQQKWIAVTLPTDYLLLQE
jgi:hypothetical protein